MRRGGAIGVFVATAALAAASDVAAKDPLYRKLPANEIRARVVGMAITDDAHWSDHFHAGGVLIAYDMGRLKRGTWKLDGDELCMTRPEKGTQTTDCFEIWDSGDTIQYRRDGVVITDAYVRPIPKGERP